MFGNIKGGMAKIGAIMSKNPINIAAASSNDSPMKRAVGAAQEAYSLGKQMQGPPTNSIDHASVVDDAKSALQGAPDYLKKQYAPVFDQAQMMASANPMARRMGRMG